MPLTTDGRWTAEPAGTASYTTRIVVYRPSAVKRFSGTVVFEWLNVSVGSDVAVDWSAADNEMIRRGIAWVGVSAQASGVAALRGADLDRYQSLDHAGDSYSYDIFSQAARLFQVKGREFLGGAKAERLVAVGQSQSAGRLVTYVDAVQPMANIFDGVLIHSRGARGTPLAEEPLPVVPVPDDTIVRRDLDVPVLIVQDETMLVMFGSYRVRQRDTKRLRLWEIAGTAHADYYATALGPNDTGDGSAERSLLDVTGRSTLCAQLTNAGPQYAVLQAAFRQMDRWVRQGTPPPRAPRLTLEAGSTPTIKRDDRGIALGGIRTPLVEVPIVSLRGDGNAGAGLCPQAGSTMPFDDATLTAALRLARRVREGISQGHG